LGKKPRTSGYYHYYPPSSKGFPSQDAKTSTGFSALHFACAMGNLSAVDSLLRLRADLNARTAHEVTPLHLATENGHVIVAAWKRWLQNL